MEAIQNLTNYNWFIIVSAIIIAMLAFKFLSELFDWFVKKFGIETKAMREKRESADLLKVTATNLAALQAEHKEDEETFNIKLDRHIAESERDRNKLHIEQKSLTDSINKLTSIVVDKEISDYRWEIINLADKILDGKKVSKECLKHAVATHAKYEVVIEENGLTNGEVDISMEIINDEYRNRLKDGID